MNTVHSPLPPQGGRNENGQNYSRKASYDSEHVYPFPKVEVRPIQTTTSDAHGLSARIRQPLSERLIIIILYLLSIVNVFRHILCFWQKLHFAAMR